MMLIDADFDDIDNYDDDHDDDQTMMTTMTITIGNDDDDYDDDDVDDDVKIVKKTAAFVSFACIECSRRISKSPTTTILQ